MKIAVINGANLGALGSRQPEVYGRETLSSIEAWLKERYQDIEFSFAQTDIEGEIVTLLHKTKADGIVLNAGAYTHYSYAIADAVRSISVPVIEVHLSNIYARESFRAHSVLSPAVKATVCGFGKGSYALAVEALKQGYV